MNYVIDVVVGQRVPAEDELEGLDIPEMGALCYPEFVLKPQSIPSGAAAQSASAMRVARETA